MTEKIGIFVADDDPSFRKSLHNWFESKFVPTRYVIPLEAGTVDEALGYIPDALRVNKIKAALIDNMFGNESAGLQIVQAITDSGLSIAMLSCATVPLDYLKIHVGKDPLRIEAALNQMFPPRRRKR